ncbi:hypothetical protein OE88DRAFT_1665890 [Heliocybe sulcata]|uniref:Uncharacterized protein n=1 Tax=Heliocybe sulcata TaxID=5364 RepID=A0A5C3MT72_9AGAM|nr:hypothetical protein OE88DRAFT_1665890 [Heliocybe sulcata]
MALVMDPRIARVYQELTLEDLRVVFDDLPDFEEQVPDHLTVPPARTVGTTVDWSNGALEGVCLCPEPYDWLSSDESTIFWEFIKTFEKIAKDKEYDLKIMVPPKRYPFKLPRSEEDIVMVVGDQVTKLVLSIIQHWLPDPRTINETRGLKWDAELFSEAYSRARDIAPLVSQQGSIQSQTSNTPGIVVSDHPYDTGNTAAGDEPVVAISGVRVDQISALSCDVVPVEQQHRPTRQTVRTAQKQESHENTNEFLGRGKVWDQDGRNVSHFKAILPTEIKRYGYVDGTSVVALAKNQVELAMRPTAALGQRVGAACHKAPGVLSHIQQLLRYEQVYASRFGQLTDGLTALFMEMPEKLEPGERIPWMCVPRTEIRLATLFMSWRSLITIQQELAATFKHGKRELPSVKAAADVLLKHFERVAEDAKEVRELQARMGQVSLDSRTHAAAREPAISGQRLQAPVPQAPGTSSQGRMPGATQGQTEPSRTRAARTQANQPGASARRT